jgi:predicted nucleotidyltransferase component of viral defense system
VTVIYRFDTSFEPVTRMRLKVEINTREHFSVLGVQHVPFEVENPWFTGSTNVSTYAIDELLCTKLRALYQRKKGRDLFDVWLALDQGHIDPATLLTCFERYMTEDGRTVTRAQFEANLAQKRKQPDFRDDVGPILRPGFSWDFDAGLDSVLEGIVARLPGDPWKGEDQPTQ